MELLNKESDEIILIIIYESQNINVIKCKAGDKIKDILIAFASNINLDYSSLLILYSGKTLGNDDLNQTFFFIMNLEDKKSQVVNLLIYRKYPDIFQEKNDINIILIIDSKNVFVLKGKKQEKIKDIINRNSYIIGTNISSYIFNYGMREISINKKFDDLANFIDKIFSGMTLLVYSKHPLKVEFVNINCRTIAIDCFWEDRIKDICKIYCSKINKKVKDFTFIYGTVELDINQSFSQMLSSINDLNSKMKIPIINETCEENNVTNNYFKIIEINANEHESCFKRHKKLLIIISMIIIIIVIISVVIIIVK